MWRVEDRGRPVHDGYPTADPLAAERVRLSALLRDASERVREGEDGEALALLDDAVELVERVQLRQEARLPAGIAELFSSTGGVPVSDDAEF